METKISVHPTVSSVVDSVLSRRYSEKQKKTTESIIHATQNLAPSRHRVTFNAPLIPEDLTIMKSTVKHYRAVTGRTTAAKSKLLLLLLLLFQ